MSVIYIKSFDETLLKLKSNYRFLKVYENTNKFSSFFLHGIYLQDTSIKYPIFAVCRFDMEGFATDRIHITIFSSTSSMSNKFSVLNGVRQSAPKKFILEFYRNATLQEEITVTGKINMELRGFL